MSNFFWIGWLIAIVTFCVGHYINAKIRKQERIRSLVELYMQKTQELEDYALGYWVNMDEKVYIFQLNIKIKRLSTISKRLTKEDKSLGHPVDEYIWFKKSISLDCPDDIRPLDISSDRAKRIMMYSHRLQMYYEDRI